MSMRRWARLLSLLGAISLVLPSPALAQCGVYKTWTEHEILTTTHINNAF